MQQELALMHNQLVILKSRLAEARRDMARHFTATLYQHH